MPTGLHLSHPRELLFDAAERVLCRDGASALTSRAVTVEAGVAKGVMHRHFADFDAFLAELILDRATHLAGTAAGLRRRAGVGSVVDNLTESLEVLFTPLVVATVALVITRDGLRSRLRDAGATRFPLLTEATTCVAEYLAAEQELGRIVAATDIATLALTLIGAVHLLYTEHDNGSLAPGALSKVVATVLASTAQQQRTSHRLELLSRDRPRRSQR